MKTEQATDVRFKDKTKSPRCSQRFIETKWKKRKEGKPTLKFQVRSVSLAAPLPSTRHALLRVAVRGAELGLKGATSRQRELHTKQFTPLVC